jgi:hypothetical protein
MERVYDDATLENARANRQQSLSVLERELETLPGTMYILQVMLSRSHSNDRSNSVESSDDEWDDDDVGAVRRYHLDFERNRDNLSLPAEFIHESFPKRLRGSFLELRTCARQRRAARLLTMPTESFHYKLHTCLLT